MAVGVSHAGGQARGYGRPDPGPDRVRAEQGRAMPGHGRGEGARSRSGADGPLRADRALVLIRDLAGRPRGTGFLADDLGTLITSHEAVDGLARLVLCAPGDRTCLVDADAVTALPEADLALVRTEGLAVQPLPVAAAADIEPGTRVRLRARGWLDGWTVDGTAAVTYTATDRFHLLGTALELSVDAAGEGEPADREALALGGAAAGGPVLDARTGAVIAVLGTALHAGHRAGGFAVPLRAAAAADPGGPLAALLERNAATVPAYGRELNLAGALQLTGLSVGSGNASGGAAESPPGWREPVERPHTAEEFRAFEAGGAAVLALVGDPGTGRTTELAALAARRACGAEPMPTVWLRGADLRAADRSLTDAVGRALERAGRIITASAGEAGTIGDAGAATPDALARLARVIGRPLLILLDGPEEMPPVLAHRLPEWTERTANWLREAGARLVVACRPEYWEQAGALFPAALRYVPRHPAETPRGAPARALPDCVRLGDLPPHQAEQARERYGIPPAALTEADARHPLALRLLAEVRAALPEEAERPREAAGTGDDAPPRWDVFSAYLDLMCLRIAERLAAAERPAPRGSAVRRLAARVAGQAHEAARRCLGPEQGELGRESFEEIFPWRTGWASAVLTEGLLVPTGAGYRFAHEEFADWLQGNHLDLDVALNALVHRWRADASVLEDEADGVGGSGAAGGGVGVPGVAASITFGTAGTSATSFTPTTSFASVSVPQARAPRQRARRGRAAGDRTRVSETVPAQGGAAASGSGSGSESVSTAGPDPLPVPRHRIGPVIQALLLLGRQQGPAHLARRLENLVHALDAPYPYPSADGGGLASPRPPVADPAWWAAHLLGEVLLRVPDSRPYLGVLRLLAERITLRSVRRGGFALSGEWEGEGDRPAEGPPEDRAGSRVEGRTHGQSGRNEAERDLGGPEGRHPHDLGGLAEFGPWFWLRLPLDLAARLDLLRLLLPADGPPPAAEDGRAGLGALGAAATGRFLPAVRDLLCADPREVQPLLCRWFADGRPLQAARRASEGADAPDERPTVAAAAQALLYTHRRRAVDDLTEALVAAAHSRADELLTALAEDEPSALCRAVDRWAHDERPERHVAAAAYGPCVAPWVRTAADRELLRYSALVSLGRAADAPLHGAALALLVRDPATRATYLEPALKRFAAGDRHVPSSAFAPALDTHPEPVLAVFRARLYEAGEGSGEVLRTLAEVTAPALARRAAMLVREHVTHRPEGAGHAAAFVDRRLEHGPEARAVVFPLVVDLLREHPSRVRRALVPVLAEPGTAVSRPLRQELLEVLLEREQYGARYGEPRLPGAQDAQGAHELQGSHEVRKVQRESAGPDLDVLDALLLAVAEGAARRPEARTRDLVHRTGMLLVRTPEGAACFDRRVVQLAREVPGFAGLVRGWLESAPGEWAAVVGPSALRQCEVLAGVARPARRSGAGPAYADASGGRTAWQS
ncbi:trypsin-like peptidase domain-containing protein [Streptomyces sp. H27-D2]|uniref:trypsin-like peptidase domain-containing protein n=1 Tax=Streptomyces sp. H27-D2 TaxID=3046304 RepID=UPI002DB78E0C|nr:trypsin-like peptidase domain-containing protein [Streptomyces sp. H27-D2]MEC4020596.1 trypsin-like peptidase domain-containing protein [Streptomyces sp. H27-D2]